VSPQAPTSGKNKLVCEFNQNARLLCVNSAFVLRRFNKSPVFALRWQPRQRFSEVPRLFYQAVFLAAFTDYLTDAGFSLI
jgi:hypothetical protein